MDLIRLIRLPNLLIVIATQSVVYFGLMVPRLERNRLTASTGPSEFIQLCAITLLIAIGGYMINDILDIRTDQINKPGKLVIGTRLSITWAKGIYVTVLLLGLAMSTYYALKQDVLHLLFIYPLAVGLLAFYSYTLKRTPLAGNILVSGFASFVVAILIVFNQPVFIELKRISPISHTTLMIILIAFMIFAFLSSLFREIVKDLEDLEGDQQAGLNTTVVAFGVKRTRLIALVPGLVLLGGLVYWSFHSLNQISIWLQLFGLLLAIYNGLILYRFWQADDKTGYHQVSTSIKLLMGAGLLYLMLYTIVM